MNKRIIAAVGAAALVIPAAASADSSRDRGHGKRTDGGAATTNGKRPAKRTKKVTFVFKGTFTGGGAVSVRSGNAHARRGGFLGQAVTFDLAGARIVVADTNADQKVDLADVLAGDSVVVKARLAKGTKRAAAADGQAAEQIVATQLIDKSNADDGDAGSAAD